MTEKIDERTYALLYTIANAVRHSVKTTVKSIGNKNGVWEKLLTQKLFIHQL